jgi:hypothetical protein
VQRKQELDVCKEMSETPRSKRGPTNSSGCKFST